MKLEITRSIVITLTVEEAADFVDILNTSEQALLVDQCSDDAIVLRGQLLDRLAEELVDL